MDFAESCEIYMFDQSSSSLLHWNDPEDIYDGMKWIFLVSDSYLEEMNAIAVMSSRYGAYRFMIMLATNSPCNLDSPCHADSPRCAWPLM